MLLVALAATSLRVGAMHRELRRLRGYQTQYVQVFGETSRAADSIGDALRQIGGEGREALQRLEAAIELEPAISPSAWKGMARAAEPKAQRNTSGRDRALLEQAACAPGTRGTEDLGARSCRQE